MATDGETSVRGYIVAGEPAFLGGYRRAVDAWKPELAALRKLANESPAQQQRLDRLEGTLGGRLEFLADLRKHFDDGARGAELTPMMLDGKRAMDAARAVFSEMETEEVRNDDARRATETRNWQVTFLLFVAGVLSFVVMLASVFVQRRDAAARRLRNEDIARAHALFRSVLEGTDMGVTVLDAGGKMLYANAPGASIIGFDSPDALLAAPISEVIARYEMLDAEGTVLPIEKLPSRAALRGEHPEEIVVRFRMRDSREQRTSLLRSVPSFDSEGRVAFVINFIREVTAKAKLDEQRAFLLRAADTFNSSLEHEQTLGAVTRMAVPGLADWCAIDLVQDTLIKRVAVAHVDTTKLDFVKELESRYPSDPNATTGVPQVIRSGRPEFVAEIPQEMIRAAAIDAEHLRLIDFLQLHSYICVPLTVRGKTIGALTLVMAESRRRYDRLDLEFATALADRAALAIEHARLFLELEKANTAGQALLVSEKERRVEAENASRFADVFIGILGHDLRNPLNAVLMATQLMRHRVGGDTKTLDRIESSTRRMSAMVTQLLDLARSRLGGGIELTPVRSELAAITTGIIEELRLIHPARQILLEQREIWGFWDADRLAQVISNLVGNAVEHGDPYKPVNVRIAEAGEEVHLTVYNEGTLIPADLLPTLFDPYRRAMARGAKSKGLGLGLFITQQIMTAHGGRVDVRSDSTGTTFVAVLPYPPSMRTALDLVSPPRDS